jgi:hypothetical protein
MHRANLILLGLLGECNPGLTCVYSANGALCRPFCGGPKMVQCENGKRCVPLTFGIGVNVVGVCNG